MNSVLIVETDASAYVAEIEKRNLPELQILSVTSPEEAAPLVSQVQIIFGRPDFIAPILSSAGNLEWVQSTYAGIEPLCAAGLRTDYLLTGVKDVFGPLMSEYVFGQILARERSILKTYNNQLKHHWEPIPYRGLDGLTIGIIGIGSIGSEIARTAVSFNMRVLGVKRTPGESRYIEQTYLPTEMPAFLPHLDYLVIILPDTPDTRGFISLSELKMMKETAVLVNVGRGSSVKQDDLVTALESGIIGGAILDVFEEEPLPTNSSLWDMPGVIITPHNSAFSFPEQITEIFCNNYQNFRTGSPLDHQVDLNRKY